MEKNTDMFLQPPRYCLLSSSSTYHLIIPQFNDVGEMIDDQITQRRQIERKYLQHVIKCFRYLARQGIPLQGLLFSMLNINTFTMDVILKLKIN